MEGAHLQILKNDVLCGTLAVEGVLDREGIPHIHAQLLGIGVVAILGHRFLWVLRHFLVGQVCRHGRVAVTTHQREPAVESEHVLLAVSHHPFLTSQDVGDVGAVMARVMPFSLRVAIFRLEECGGEHAVEAVFQVVLQCKVDAVVAACPFVYQSSVLVEQVMVDDGVSAAFSTGTSKRYCQ